MPDLGPVDAQSAVAAVAIIQAIANGIVAIINAIRAPRALAAPPANGNSKGPAPPV